jgi:hypothetical protein
MTSEEHGCDCDAFVKAQQRGTDNEGYDQLIYRYSADLLKKHPFLGGDPRWSVGSELPPIHFCPWCGSKLADP